MEAVFFKTDASPVRFCTSGGKIDFSALGQEFGLDPTSIKLNDTKFSDEQKSTDTWTAIKNFFEQQDLPLGTEAKPVIVTGAAPVRAAMDSSGVRFRGSPLEGMGSRLISGECSKREGTVSELCRMLKTYGAVLIRAPPQTGKTSLLDLMQVDPVSVRTFKKIYRINLAQLTESCTFDDIWKSDIEEGVSFNDFQDSPKSSPEGKGNLLLVDEGQKGFEFVPEIPLWSLLKLIQGGYKQHLNMLIVSAWGSHGDHATITPGSWAPQAVVGLWPTKMTKISLQLTVEEATEIWESSTVSARLSDSTRDMIFDLSDRQPGLLIHVLDFLRQCGFQNAANCDDKAFQSLTSLSFTIAYPLFAV